MYELFGLQIKRRKRKATARALGSCCPAALAPWKSVASQRKVN